MTCSFIADQSALLWLKPLFLPLFILLTPNIFCPGLVEMLVSARGIVIGPSSLSFNTFEKQALAAFTPDELQRRIRQHLIRRITVWVWLGIILAGLSEFTSLVTVDQPWEYVLFHLTLLILKSALLFLLAESAVSCFLRLRKTSAVFALLVLGVLLAGYIPHIIFMTAMHIGNLANAGQLPWSDEYNAVLGTYAILFTAIALAIIAKHHLKGWNSLLLRKQVLRVSSLLPRADDFPYPSLSIRHAVK